MNCTIGRNAIILYKTYTEKERQSGKKKMIARTERVKKKEEGKRKLK